jgi:large repetitive protein
MKMKMFCAKNWLMFVIVLVMSNCALAQQTYTYNFRNSLNEEGGNGPALNVLGSGSYTSESLPDLSCLSRTVYGFTQNSGLQFDNGAAGNFMGSSYSIEMYFRFTTNTGFIRVIDFKNRTADSGLYATSAVVQFYDELNINTTAFATNEYVHLVLTRNGGNNEVNIYIDGSLAGSFTDNNGRALPNGSNVINFFQDDLVFGGEAQPGNIALLRIHDYTLDATMVSDNYGSLEAASGTVAFSPDILSAPLPGNVFNFTNESQNSGGVTYSWEFGDGNTDTGTNSSHSYSTTGNFDVLLIADNGGGCTDSATVTVSVTPAGNPTITPSGTVHLCTGGSVILTSSPGLSYSWNNGPTSQAIMVTFAGTYFVTVEVSPGVFQNSDTITVTKYSWPPGGINNFYGSTVACPGTSYNYSVNPVNRVSYYTWTMPAGATSSGQNPLVTTSNSIIVDFAAGFTGGVIEVTAHNGCGVRGPSTKTVNVSPPLTPQPINGPQTACPNTTYSYSSNVVIGVTSYNWVAPAGATISGQGNSTVDITFPAGFVAGYVRVTHTSPCGTSNQRSLYVRSNPANPGTITGPVSGLCGSIQTYTVQPALGATSYTWLAPTGSTVISGQGTTTCQISFNNGLNTGYVRVTANNACGASGISRLAIVGGVVISNEPVNASVCTGDPASFTVAAPGSNLIFQWRKDGVNLANGGNISGVDAGTLNISPTSAGNAGNYDCIVRRSCGRADTSAIATLTLGTIAPVPGTISGQPEACPGEVGIAYSIAPVPGAISYNWGGDTGVTIASGQGTTDVTVDFSNTPLSGYTIFVLSVNGCGQSDTSRLWVRTKVGTPNFTTAPATACAGTSGIVYEVGAVVGASSYDWTAPANASISSGQGTASVTVDFNGSFTTGEICVTASNHCFTSPPRCKNITSLPATPGNIQGATTNVCNSTQSYTVNSAVGATGYQWTAPAGASISAGQGTNSVSVDFGPSFVSGFMEVISQNVCGNSSTRSRFVVAFPAKPDSVFGPVSVCANSSGNNYSITPLAGATSYIWTLPSGASITSGTGTPSVTVTFGSVDGIITAAGSNACGTGFSKGTRVDFTCRETVVVGDLAMSAFPNPVHDLLILQIDLPESVELNIALFDLSGRMVINETASGYSGKSELTLDLTGLAPGIYTLKMNAGEQVMMKKIVKK